MQKCHARSQFQIYASPHCSPIGPLEAAGDLPQEDAEVAMVALFNQLGPVGVDGRGHSGLDLILGDLSDNGGWGNGMLRGRRSSVGSPWMIMSGPFVCSIPQTETLHLYHAFIAMHDVCIFIHIHPPSVFPYHDTDTGRLLEGYSIQSSGANLLEVIKCPVQLGIALYHHCKK